MAQALTATLERIDECVTGGPRIAHMPSPVNSERALCGAPLVTARIAPPDTDRCVVCIDLMPSFYLA